MQVTPGRSPSGRSIRHAILAAATLSVPCALAGAQTTYVVDDDAGPGVDFTTIQDALNVAGFVDVIEVRPGSYAPFTMRSPTRLIGEPGVRVNDQSEIATIEAGEWTVVAGLQLERLRVRDCAGTVVLDDLRLSGGSAVLVVDSSLDVRGRRVSQLQSGTGSALVFVSASNLQLSGCAFVCGTALDGNEGHEAITLEDASFLHLTDCEVEGERGGDRSPFFKGLAGDGGDGIRAWDDSSTRTVRSEVRGERGGLDPMTAIFDGLGGDGLAACGGTHEVWESVVAGGDTSGFHPPGDAFRMSCGAILEEQRPLPSLSQSGLAEPGLTVTLGARAEAASSGRLLFGRLPVRVSVPGSGAPRLVDVGRIASLGSMPQSGVLPIQLALPAWPRGTVVFLQTSRTIGGDTQMSNAVAIVVR